MTLLSFVFLLFVAGVCGAIAQSIVGYTHAGCLGSIALGFIGALLGVFIARGLGLPEVFAMEIGGTSFPVVWSIAGASLFVAILGLFTRRRYYRAV